MQKVNATVRRETGYVAVWVVGLSAVMQAVFLLFHWWSLSVLWGNLLGGGAAVANFFLMGLTVQKAVNQTEQQARRTVALSQTGRMLFLAAAAVAGVLLFHLWATVIPLLFPRVAVATRQWTQKKNAPPGGEIPPQTPADEDDEDDDL